MAWSLIASGSAASFDTVGVTVGPLNCVGAEVIVVVLGGYGGALTHFDMNDDSANSYTLRLQQPSSSDGSLWSGIYYVLNPTVDSAMTFTFARGSFATFPGMVVYAFSGLAASPTIDAAVSGAGGTSAQAGSIGVADDLIVEGLAWFVNNGMAIDSGFATPLQLDYAAAVNVGTAASYKLVVSGAENPTWTWSGSNFVAASAVAITGTGGGGTGQPILRRFGGLPHVGGHGIGSKGTGRMWGRSRDGVIVPRRFAA